LTRTGRKRKFRGTKPLADREGIDTDRQYRLLSSLQPHRRDLPPDSRLDPNASTELGRLFIRAQITREQHIAGERWGYTVGQYRATLEAPRAVSGSGRGATCTVNLGCDTNCECEKRRRAYRVARSALFAHGPKVARVVDDVVIWGDDCRPVHLAALRLGLSALAKHFGIT
jgi:hypothetical protein